MSVTNKNVVRVTESRSERGDGDATTISMTKVGRAAMPARKLLSLVVTLLPVSCHQPGDSTILNQD